MRTTIKLLTVLALALATFGQYTAASAATNFKYTGKAAFAYFYGFDPSGCIRTEVYVFAGEDVFQDVPGKRTPSPYAQVMLSQYNFCTQESLLYGDGFAELAELDFEISRNLS